MSTENINDKRWQVQRSVPCSTSLHQNFELFDQGIFVHSVLFLSKSAVQDTYMEFRKKTKLQENEPVA